METALRALWFLTLIYLFWNTTFCIMSIMQNRKAMRYWEDCIAAMNEAARKILLNPAASEEIYEHCDDICWAYRRMAEYHSDKADVYSSIAYKPWKIRRMK